MTEKRKNFVAIVIVVLLVLLVLRILLGAYLWKRADGFFVLLRGDDMSRVFQGWQMQRAGFPSFISHLCPLTPWLYAKGFLHISHDIFFVPALINTLLGLVAISFMFLLTGVILEDGFAGASWGGLLTLGLAIFYPPFVWATLAGDRYLGLLSTVFMGLFFWIMYIKKWKKLFLFLSAVSFLLSTAAMHQGWIFATIFTLFIFKEVVLHYRRSKRFGFFHLGCACVSLSFIFAHIYFDCQRFGSPIGFLMARHGTPGMPATFWERLESFPSLLAKSFIFPFLQLFSHRVSMTRYPFVLEKGAWLICVAVLLGAIVQARRIGRLAFAYALFVLGVVVVSCIMAAGGFAVNCSLPAEFLIYNFCVIPLLSVCIYDGIRKIFPNKARNQFICICAIIFLISSLHGIVSLYPPKSQMRTEAMQLGMLIKSLYSKDKISSEDTILLEQRVEADNFSLAIEPYMLQLFAPDKIIFDREWKMIVKNNIGICDTNDNPSLFESPIDIIHARLQKNRVRLLILRTVQAIKKVKSAMTHIVNIGEYQMYASPDEFALISYIRNTVTQLAIPWLGRSEKEEPLG